MLTKKFLFLNVAALVLTLGHVTTSQALDINRCPEKMTITYSGIDRISKQELTEKVKELYNYSTDQDTSGPVKANWNKLEGVKQYKMEVKLRAKEDHIATPYCLYLTGTAGIFAKFVEGADRSSADLQVSSPYGETMTKVLSYGPNGVELSQDQEGRQIVNYAHAGYEDGGYTATIAIGEVGELSVH